MSDKYVSTENTPSLDRLGSALVERGRTFRFNDHVVVEMLIGVTDEKRSGRLVQVRRNCGQFGSNVYLIRLRDGSLMTFENVMIRHVNDQRFEQSFYRDNGMIPPIVGEQPVDDTDTEHTEYTIGDRWPETGFIVDRPVQPETPGLFAVAISMPNTRNEAR